MKSSRVTPPVPNRLKACREGASISRPGLADRVGVSERTIYRWEEQEIGIPDHRKIKLAEVLGVTVAELIEWTSSDEEIAA